MSLRTVVIDLGRAYAAKYFLALGGSGFATSVVCWCPRARRGGAAESQKARARSSCGVGCPRRSFRARGRVQGRFRCVNSVRSSHVSRGVWCVRLVPNGARGPYSVHSTRSRETTPLVFRNDHTHRMSLTHNVIPLQRSARSLGASTRAGGSRCRRPRARGRRRCPGSGAGSRPRGSGRASS